MTNSKIEEATDAELLKEAEEFDDIMKVAVENAVAENKQLGLYTDSERPATKPRVAEED